MRAGAVAGGWAALIQVPGSQEGFQGEEKQSVESEKAEWQVRGGEARGARRPHRQTTSTGFWEVVPSVPPAG